FRSFGLPAPFIPPRPPQYDNSPSVLREIEGRTKAAWPELAPPQSQNCFSDLSSAAREPGTDPAPFSGQTPRRPEGLPYENDAAQPRPPGRTKIGGVRRL